MCPALPWTVQLLTLCSVARRQLGPQSLVCVVPQQDAAAGAGGDAAAPGASGAASNKENCPPCSSGGRHRGGIVTAELAGPDGKLAGTVSACPCTSSPAAPGSGGGSTAQGVFRHPTQHGHMADPDPKPGVLPKGSGPPAGVEPAAAGAAALGSSAATAWGSSRAEPGSGSGWIEEGALIGCVAAMELRQASRTQTLLLNIQVAVPHGRNALARPSCITATHGQRFNTAWV